MIEAIIFDCFGVLATEGWLPFKERYFGHDEVLMAEAGNLIQQASAGLMSNDDFVIAIAALADIERAQVTSMLGRNVPNLPLLEYIEQLKPQYKIGLLSNSASNWLPDIFTPEQIALFDTIVLSYETGMAKPDPRIYTLAAEKLDVTPSACIFVDDQQWYATAAEDVGMHGIWYEDFPQLRHDLEQYLQDLAKKA